jgi:serine/threonine protein kinase
MFLSVACLLSVGLCPPAAVCAQPENLLYASSDPKSPDYNTIKVADFGLSKFVSENSQMKTTCGTVRDGERGLVL